MQTLTVKDATPGQRYQTPRGETITVIGPNPDNPAAVQLELEGGQVIDVPNEYVVAELAKPSGVDVNSLVGGKPDQVTPQLCKLTDDELDQLLAVDSRMWLIAAVGNERDRRDQDAEPEITEATCPVCDRKRVTVRPSASRGGVLVLANHKPAGGQGVCAGSAHTLDDAQAVADSQPEPELEPLPEPVEPKRDLDLKKADNDPVPCDGNHLAPDCGAPECWQADGALIDLGYVDDADVALFGGGDPFLGAVNGPDRVAAVQGWDRTHLDAAQRLIADDPDLKIQSTVTRELERHQTRLDQVNGLPATTTKGRDELLRRRELKTTKSGVKVEIDRILAETMIEGAQEAVAENVTARFVGADVAPEQYPVEFDAFCGSLAIGPGIERRTIAAMVLNGVRGCRDASKACTDEALLGTAWDYARQQPKGGTIAKTIAARYRKLTGQSVEETAPPPTDPVGDLRRLEAGQFESVHEINAARLCVCAWIISTADTITEIEPGMICATSYETGPYVVREVRAANGGISLVLRDLRGKTNEDAAYLNELDLVDGHWVRDETNDRVSFKHHPDSPTVVVSTEGPEEPPKAPVSMARQIELVQQSTDIGQLKLWRSDSLVSERVIKAIDERLIILAANRDPQQPREAPPKAMKPAQIQHLDVISLPNGTSDLWHREPGSKPRLVGNTSNPQIDAVAKQVATYQAEQLARSVVKAPQMPAPQLEALGQLGAALAALKAAGLKATLTIEV